MRKLFCFIVCLGIQYSIFTGCCRYGIIEPAQYGYAFQIELLDKNTGRTLIVPRDTAYYPDSILLEAPHFSTVRLGVDGRDSILFSEVMPPGKLFTDTLYFKYRNTRPDTIIVFSHGGKTKTCGETYPFLVTDRITINGVTSCSPCNSFSEILRIKK